MKTGGDYMTMKEKGTHPTAERARVGEARFKGTQGRMRRGHENIPGSVETNALSTETKVRRGGRGTGAESALDVKDKIDTWQQRAKCGRKIWLRWATGRVFVLKNKDKGQGSQAKDSVDRNECTQGRDGRAEGSGRDCQRKGKSAMLRHDTPCYAPREILSAAH